MRRFTSFVLAACLAGTANADIELTYSVRVDNMSDATVTLKLDGAKPCVAPPQGSCQWDIVYGAHTLDAYVGGKQYSHNFELSDESDILVRCKFDGTGFSGDTC